MTSADVTFEGLSDDVSSETASSSAPPWLVIVTSATTELTSTEVLLRLAAAREVLGKWSPLASETANRSSRACSQPVP
eukprot:7386668-Prymnesium_polylepis.1